MLPHPELLPGLAEHREQGFVQQFITEPTVEVCFQAVLHGLARRNVAPFDAGPVAPGQECYRRHRISLILAERSDGAPIRRCPAPCCREGQSLGASYR